LNSYDTNKRSVHLKYTSNVATNAIDNKWQDWTGRSSATYNLTLFFGPGLPLGFSNPSAAAELLLTLVFAGFLMLSAGGSMAVELSVLLGAGVLGVESEPFSSGGDIATGIVFDVVDDGAFDSSSSLIVGTGAKRARLCGESVRVTIRVLVDFFDFEMLPEAGEAFDVEPILDFY
jgi:hypothetical protein